MDTEPFRRKNFFAGNLLTAQDLAQEQEYCREKLRLHNRLLHGAGVVSGLKVRHDGTDGLTLSISSGMALD